MKFLDGGMTTATMRSFEVHLDACGACRELVSALSRADSAMNARLARSTETTRMWESLASGGRGLLTADLRSGSSIGRYTVLEPLGAGGMGVVYTAYDPELERKVALKIVRTDIVDSDQRAVVQQRLLFEARAMAQLAHPNVVAVHDVGRIEDRVFVAMELVEGQTLSRWLAVARRGWREIVGVFVAAGHGLAAAHAAGMVHRDFKPANVLVGRDGRVRVSDFGLAQAGIAAPAIGATPDLATSQHIDVASGGSIIGTPYFMAPEQFRRQPADARTDQFSFCVALYHALYRQHPFHGTNVAELAEAVINGRARPLPVRPRVPRWLSRAILRGLSTSPADRYPSLDDLLRALQRDPYRPVRRGAVALVATAAVVAALVYGRSSDPRPSCADDAGRIASVWSPEARDRLSHAFAATGKPYAPAAFAEVARVFDGYSKSWAAMRLEVCEAARSGPPQAEELVGVRSMCLDGRLSQMAALVRTLASVPESVQQAPRAVHELADVSSCADPRALLGVVPPPADPVSRAVIAVVRDELASAEALHKVGRYADALARTRSLLDKMRAVHYRPLEAEILFLRGTLEYVTGKFTDGLATLKQAALAAEAGRSDDLQVKSLLAIMFVEIKFTGHPDQAENEIAPRATSIIERMGGSDELEGKLHVVLSVLAGAQHRYDVAQSEAQVALERLEHRYGPTDLGVTTALQALYFAADSRVDEHAALDVAQRLLTIRRRVYGDEHPDVAQAYLYVGGSLLETGHAAEARDALERALAIQERIVGPDHPEISDVLVSLSNVAIASGQFADALAYLRRAQAISDKTVGRNHRFYARAQLRIAKVLVEMDRDAEALALLGEVEPLVIRTTGADGLEMSELLLARGIALDRLGRHVAARNGVVASQAIFLKTLKPDDPAIAYQHRALGHIALALRRPEQAIAAFERAAATLAPEDARSVRIRADIDFGMARALTALHRDPARAHDLAETARGLLTTLPALEGRLREIETWLAQHPDRPAR